MSDLDYTEAEAMDLILTLIGASHAKNAGYAGITPEVVQQYFEATFSEVMRRLILFERQPAEEEE